ncbi:bifunctional isocitrate dehydrogenase kinase/phosphatase [Amphritea sp. 1_MG-2023]|uniref:bifunctional isocitrate dehydrogenase kinase/phosphatase n=1 Tax=Amphritea sp. 1_MG-2023 TaxID=3062670 RepID=UPI0026E26F9F|nr:bifunctional isocitrate dehydrogenase kinase/phosphatase [Amphritea sp. 1_MG-2023]MDO6562722.1 bifunctional isocitrate dehydrogenase kinase/phosphatase [Amphritea sp. 1_MG-2023]
MNPCQADAIARLILEGFNAYRQQFRALTRQANVYFEAADWHAIQRLSTQRIDLYNTLVDQVSGKIEAEMNAGLNNALWISIKADYLIKIAQQVDAELGKTFYNSIYCRLRQHRQIDDQFMFIDTQCPADDNAVIADLYRTYTLRHGLLAFIHQLLEDYRFGIPWENKRRDISHLLRYIGTHLANEIVNDDAVVHVIRSRFYRNKGAYIVGRVTLSTRSVPFILPILNNEAGGVYIDTALIDENDVSIIFSFTRTYFLVEVDHPSALIHFLHSLMPMKSIAELYNAIGFYKQGKAEFYRGYIEHLANSSDQFKVALGTKGMVMTVFTLPSYPVVFKIIKDRFATSKKITRAGVMGKYELVKRHDRAGRMADTQEFVNFSLPRKRFSDALLNELLDVAASSIDVVDDLVVIKHLWIERRMIPLNIYLDEMLRQNNEQAISLAINEFGQCIKELAAANIFAGDMFFKNFGVTRHGRVVFYDYDEIMYLTECQFRYIPEPLYPEQELAAEPWYSVSEKDVFPEEFGLLTACDQRIRETFNGLHGDLLEPGWWIDMQVKVKQGTIIDLFPYRNRCRFHRQVSS